MPVTRKVIAPGTPVLFDSHTTAPGDVPPVLVGGAGTFSDDSDATYVEFETYEHPSVSYADTATLALQPTPLVKTTTAGVTVSAWVRYQSLSVDMAPPRIQIRRAGIDLVVAEPAAPGSAATTWIEIPLPFTDANLASFLSLIDSGSETVNLIVTAPFLRTYTFRNTRTRVYEAYLMVTTPGSDAPPCRIFPRADGLGVGSGRRFPPPKSQQRSGRRFGYY